MLLNKKDFTLKKIIDGLDCFNLISVYSKYYYYLKEYNGRSILSGISFQSDNINLLGTRLLSILFTREKIMNGLVEPSDSNEYPPLDINRVNMIKGTFENTYIY